MTTPLEMTLDEAREWLRERLDDGAHCPCCTQFAKIYKRRVNSQMARALIKMHLKTEPDEYVHMPTLLERKQADDAKLVYWGLAEEDHETREDGSTRTGWWRITERGRLFATNKSTIPRWARIYDSRLLGFDGEMVSIVDALGKKFDYRELMAGTA